MTSGNHSDRNLGPELRRVARDMAPLLRRMPAYARLGVRLLRDPHLPPAVKAGLAAAGAYVASPINAIPGFVPVLGQLGDAVVGLAALRAALDRLGPERAGAHLRAAGISRADLERDLESAKQALRTLSLSAGRTALKTTGRGLRAAGRGLGAAVRWLRRRRGGGARGPEAR